MIPVPGGTRGGVQLPRKEAELATDTKAPQPDPDTTARTPGQADEIPDAYARYIRAVFPPEVLVNAPNEIAGRWKHMTGPAEREFWRSLEPPEAGDQAEEDARTIADYRYASLLEVILKNADDENRTGEPPEDLAERYVRSLERDLGEAREQLATVITDRDKLSSGGRALGLAVSMLSSTLMAAWIDAERGDPDAAKEIIAQVIENVPELEPWNGTETGTEWLERTRSEETE